jgi:hypothetical protein
MTDDQNNTSEPAKMPLAETGNASNPSPGDRQNEGVGEKQILNKKAEKYLREVSSIEDMPDAQDQQDMDEALNKNK